MNLKPDDDNNTSYYSHDSLETSFYSLNNDYIHPPTPTTSKYLSKYPAANTLVRRQDRDGVSSTANSEYQRDKYRSLLADITRRSEKNEPVNLDGGIKNLPRLEDRRPSESDSDAFTLGADSNRYSPTDAKTFIHGFNIRTSVGDHQGQLDTPKLSSVIDEENSEVPSANQSASKFFQSESKQQEMRETPEKSFSRAADGDISMSKTSTQMYREEIVQDIEEIKHTYQKLFEELGIEGGSRTSQAGSKGGSHEKYKKASPSSNEKGQLGQSLVRDNEREHTDERKRLIPADSLINDLRGQILSSEENQQSKCGLGGEEEIKSARDLVSESHERSFRGSEHDAENKEISIQTPELDEDQKGVGKDHLSQVNSSQEVLKNSEAQAEEGALPEHLGEKKAEDQSTVEQKVLNSDQNDAAEFQAATENTDKGQLEKNIDNQHEDNMAELHGHTVSNDTREVTNGTLNKDEVESVQNTPDNDPNSGIEVQENLNHQINKEPEEKNEDLNQQRINDDNDQNDSEMIRLEEEAFEFEGNTHGGLKFESTEQTEVGQHRSRMAQKVKSTYQEKDDLADDDLSSEEKKSKNQIAESSEHGNVSQKEDNRCEIGENQLERTPKLEEEEEKIVKENKSESQQHTMGLGDEPIHEKAIEVTEGVIEQSKAQDTLETALQENQNDPHDRPVAEEKQEELVEKADLCVEIGVNVEVNMSEAKEAGSKSEQPVESECNVHSMQDGEKEDQELNHVDIEENKNSEPNDEINEKQEIIETKQQQENEKYNESDLANESTRAKELPHETASVSEPLSTNTFQKEKQASSSEIKDIPGQEAVNQEPKEDNGLIHESQTKENQAGSLEIKENQGQETVNQESKEEDSSSIHESQLKTKENQEIDSHQPENHENKSESQIHHQAITQETQIHNEQDVSHTEIDRGQLSEAVEHENQLHKENEDSLNKKDAELAPSGNDVTNQEEQIHSLTAEKKGTDHADHDHPLKEDDIEHNNIELHSELKPNVDSERLSHSEQSQSQNLVEMKAEGHLDAPDAKETNVNSHETESQPQLLMDHPHSHDNLTQPRNEDEGDQRQLLSEDAYEEYSRSQHDGAEDISQGFSSSDNQRKPRQQENITSSQLDSQSKSLDEQERAKFSAVERYLKSKNKKDGDVSFSPSTIHHQGFVNTASDDINFFVGPEYLSAEEPHRAAGAEDESKGPFDKTSGLKKNHMVEKPHITEEIFEIDNKSKNKQTQTLQLILDEMHPYPSPEEKDNLHQQHHEKSKKPGTKMIEGKESHRTDGMQSSRTQSRMRAHNTSVAESSFIRSRDSPYGNSLLREREKIKHEIENILTQELATKPVESNRELVGLHLHFELKETKKNVGKIISRLKEDADHKRGMKDKMMTLQVAEDILTAYDVATERVKSDASMSLNSTLRMNKTHDSFGLTNPMTLASSKISPGKRHSPNVSAFDSRMEMTVSPGRGVPTSTRSKNYEAFNIQDHSAPQIYNDQRKYGPPMGLISPVDRTNQFPIIEEKTRPSPPK